MQVSVGDRDRRPVGRVDNAGARWLRGLVASGLLSLAWTADAAIVECADPHGVPILTSGIASADCVAAAGRRVSGRHVVAVGASSTPTPAGFPRVDPATQRTRDDDRVRILQDELDQQQQRLVALQASAPARPASPAPTLRTVDASTAETDRDRQVSRTMENIRALKSELARRF